MPEANACSTRLVRADVRVPVVKRPDYVPQHAHRAKWPIAERAGKQPEPEPRRVDPIWYLVIVVAVVVAGTAAGVVCAALWGPQAAAWVWP